MKICRFDNDRLGVVEGDRVLDVTGALDVLPRVSWPLPLGDPLVANIDKVVARIKEIKHAATPKPLTSVKLKSPVANPSKIIGAPVNYQLHIDEAAKNPAAFANPSSNMLNIRTAGPFLKANSSLVGPSEGVSLRFPDRRNDHEVELAVVIGKAGSAIPAASALDYVAGYAIGLDMTVRGTEDRSVRKSVDSYSVLGPWLVTADEIADPNNLDLWITVNNEPRQKSNTKMLILNVQQCIEFFSTYYTLLPGDIIMSGTPEGVGPVKRGDLMIAEVEKVGRMEVRVRNA
jgi:2-keto-4-pentenoate hydratase/2-oxohepta-3-ene-1,7-dioic acid hydratase in catechol pathway